MNSKLRHSLLSAFLLLGLIAMTSACDADTSATSEPAAEAADDFELTGNAEAGAQHYAVHCATCHGAEGNGQGPAGGALNPPPTDFTAGGLSAGNVYKAVKEGGMAVGKAATMPPFGNSLSEEEIQDIVAYTLAFGD